MVYLSAEWPRCHRLNFLFVLCLSLSLCSPLLLTRKIENFQKGLRHSTLYVLYRIDTLSLCLFCANFSSVWFGSAKKQEERKKWGAFSHLLRLSRSLMDAQLSNQYIPNFPFFACSLACLLQLGGGNSSRNSTKKKHWQETGNNTQVASIHAIQILTV